MPYIPKPRRRILLGLEPGTKPLWSAPPPTTPGELNFLLTHLCQTYVGGTGESYSTFNDVIGALDCAKMEFYRRVVVPYEDKKIAENGDVFGPDTD